MSRRREFKFATRDKKVEPDRWEWAVWMDEPVDVLETIAEVEYVLHSTFPNRVRLKTDRSTGFILKSGGWGTFDILVHIRMTDGEELSQKVPLRFKDPGT